MNKIGRKDDIQKLLHFGNTSEASRWHSLDDVVMGGRSSSRFEATQDGTAVFVGTLCLDRGGGFASVRSSPGPYDLSTYRGVVLHVRGDGKTYNLNLHADTPSDGMNFRAVFVTASSAWSTVRVPFKEFEPSLDGRRPAKRSAPTLRRIATFSLGISDHQEGPFRLEIAWIGGWR